MFRDSFEKYKLKQIAEEAAKQYVPNWTIDTVNAGFAKLAREDKSLYFLEMGQVVYITERIEPFNAILLDRITAEGLDTIRNLKTLENHKFKNELSFAFSLMPDYQNRLYEFQQAAIVELQKFSHNFFGRGIEITLNTPGAEFGMEIKPMVETLDLDKYHPRI